jgi:diguanylate cyclase (GGDEF)-like protein
VDDRRLSAALVDFARTLAADFSVQKTLDLFAERVVRVLPVTGAGILLMGDEQDHHFVATTDAVIMRIESLQMDLGEGPCLQAHRSGRRVLVPDLAVDGRFTRFSPQAVEAGLGAVFSFPLHFDGHRLGALELYSARPTRLSEADLDVAQTLADVMAAYLQNARRRSTADRTVAALQEQALHDPLTGLPNRTLLQDRLQQAVRNGRRDPPTFVGVLFLDVDDLKAVNDRFGHDAGDALLKAVVSRVSGVLRPGDTMARLAGDEFVIVCDGLTRGEQADEVAVRIHEVLGEPVDLGGTLVAGSVSIGIGFAGEGHGTPAEALARADALMYQAKRRARGGTAGAADPVVTLDPPRTPEPVGE